jgi:hypothetical protein
MVIDTGGSMRIVHTTAALACAALALAAPFASAARTITLTERQTFFHETDNAPKGPSSSDVIAIRGVLSQHGKAVGHDAVRCSGDRHCTATLSFGGGTLVARGTQTGESFDVEIVRGTGTFAHARGTIHVAMSSTGSRYSIEVR